jgi:hypothetical protein
MFKIYIYLKYLYYLNKMSFNKDFDLVVNKLKNFLEILKVIKKFKNKMN